MAKVLAFLIACVSMSVTAEATYSEYGVEEVSECTEGFPSLFHINKVADKEPGTKDKRQVLIPDINFSCNGSVTRWIFGAKWEGNTPAHTELQIWRRNSATENTYRKVNGTIIMVNTKNDSEVYVLETPLAFQEGDILGYFQPKKGKSELDLYLEKSGQITTHYMMVGNDVVTSTALLTFSIDDDNIMTETNHPLIAVRTDPPDCGRGFMSVERIYALLCSTGMRKDFNDRQIIFPDITFSCSGEVVKWIVAEKWDANKMNPPELQIWRLSEGSNNNYRKLNSTIILPGSKEDDEVYEYTVDPPLPFQPGDILGVLQPGGSKLKVRYEKDGDSVYYYSEAEVNNEVFDISGTSISTETDLPLVTVEIVQYTSLRVLLPSSTTVLSSISLTISAMSSGEMTTTFPTTHSSQPTAVGVKTTSLSQPGVKTTSLSQPPFSSTTITDDVLSLTAPSTAFSQISSVSPSQEGSTDQSAPTTTSVYIRPSISSKPQQKSKLSSTVISQTPGNIDISTGSHSSVGGAVGGAVGAAIVLLLAMSVLGVGLLIVWRRRNTSKVVLQPVPVNGTVAHLDNPVYGDNTVSGNGNGIHCYKSTQQQDDNYIYESLGAEYESVDSPNKPMAFHNPTYSDTGPVTDESLVSTTENIYVPTTVERKRRMEKGCQEDVYSTPDTTNGQQEFFEEADIYWAPASTVTGIYEQLSHHKYREISRQHIEVGGSLGSGQFGMVSRGKWLAAVGGPVDVAIKTLQSSAKETDRVKFLQEAAINGQFRHPNIVQLHGVVTVGDPVMIVLEYMPNGDLRDFLHSLKAQLSPSQQSELSQQCLSFSQHVAGGMSYLAGKAFVHRDLAARNILVSKTRICKVADFGMTRDLDEGSYYVSHGGQVPVKWTAPEALHYKKYSTASDVWSFGCLMYEIWSLGHKPFEGYTNQEALKLVMKGHRLAPPPGCPRHIYSLMMSCWHPEKSSRPSFHSLCQSLDGEPATLLQWREEDTQCHPQASLLGAELEAGKNLYTELQQLYLQK